MKKIKYQYLSCEINHGTEQEPSIEQVIIGKELDWSEDAEALAKKEAIDGVYTIEDDGRPEPEPAPGTEELEAENEDMRNALGVLGVTV